MARKRAGSPKNQDGPTDRHDKEDVTIRIPKEFVGPLHCLIQRFAASGYTELVRNAIREYLERHDLWPAPPPEAELKAAAEAYLKRIGLFDQMIQKGLWPK